MAAKRVERSAARAMRRELIVEISVPETSCELQIASRLARSDLCRSPMEVAATALLSQPTQWKFIGMPRDAASIGILSSHALKIFNNPCAILFAKRQQEFVQAASLC